MLRLTFFLAMMFTVLVASIFRTPMIVFMAALMCATLVTGFVLGRRSGRGLAVTRTMPEVASVGDIVGGRITVHNSSRWPGFFIHLHAGQVDSPHEAAGAGGARVEKSSGVPPPRGPIVAVGSAEHTVPLLRPGESVIWEPQWRLRQRGVYRLPPVHVGSGDPLGMFNLSQPLTGTHTITVLPRPIKLHRLGFLGGADVGLRAPQHATAVTEAMDFHGIRLWHPGEGLRRVHWKSTARTGNIHVVEWEENLACDLTVLLDTQAASAPPDASGDGHREAWESAVTLTASIADYLLENGFRFELFCWQRPPTVPLPVSSMTGTVAASASGHAPEPHAIDNIQLCYHTAYNANGTGATLKLLAQIEPLSESEATLSSLARHAAPRIERGGSVVIVATTRADIAGALQILEMTAPRGTNGYAVVLDADSFDAASSNDPDPKSGYRTRARNAAGAATPAPSSSTFFPTAAMRLVRHGDSLADALELA